MQTIAIDQDEVITEGGFLYAINHFLNTNYKKEDFTEFYMQDIIPDNLKKDFFNYLIDLNIYNHCYFLENSVKTIFQLNKQYDLCILTSYLIREVPYLSGKLLLQKHNFLMENLPFLNPKQFIFTARKDLVHTDIKIDDLFTNLKNAKTKLLFTNYHNRTLDDKFLHHMGIERVDGWNEIGKKLLKK